MGPAWTAPRAQAIWILVVLAVQVVLKNGHLRTVVTAPKVVAQSPWSVEEATMAANSFPVHLVALE